MFTEVQFSAVAEPSTYAVLFGLFAFGLAVVRRHRRPLVCQAA